MCALHAFRRAAMLIGLALAPFSMSLFSLILLPDDVIAKNDGVVSVGSDVDGPGQDSYSWAGLTWFGIDRFD